MSYYAGIGSRNVPSDIAKRQFEIGALLASKGMILRSGGCEGSDLNFENGCDSVGGKKQIFLPWKKPGKNPPDYFDKVEEKAFKLLWELVDEYKDFNRYAKMSIKLLCARNMYQILGPNLDDPVDFVVCWTKNGEEVGGTRWALRLAKKHEIKIYNLFHEDSFTIWE